MRLPVQSLPVDHTGHTPAMGGVTPSLKECLTVTVQNGQVCLDIPVVGKHCISLPVPLPEGTSAQACIETCGSFIPTGACVTVSALGHQIVKECFGLC